MEIKFTTRFVEVWHKRIHDIEFEYNIEPINALYCYLRELSYNLEFAKEILSQLDSNKLFDIDFSSSYWGVDITDDKFKIYSLMDENDTENQTTLTKHEFRTVIFEWIAFLKNPPNEGYEKLVSMN